MVSKFVVAMFCAWIAVVLVVVTALDRGCDRVRHRSDPVVPALLTNGQSTGDILCHLLVSTAYVAWSLTGVVAFSFMVSCMTDAPFGAIFAGVGLYFTSLILDAISSLGSIRYVLPTHYFDTWVDLLTRGEWHADLWRGVLLQLVYVTVFFLDRAVVVPPEGHQELTDWTTVAELATAAGTLVLAVATFGATRTANRAARTAERAFEARLRPVLVQSRREDPVEKIMWGDRHWSRVPGGQAWVEADPEAVYLAMSLRNVGAGMAVIHGWHAESDLEMGIEDHSTGRHVPAPGAATSTCRRRDSSFWQGAFRENDPGGAAEFGALIARTSRSRSSCSTATSKVGSARSPASPWCLRRRRRSQQLDRERDPPLEPRPRRPPVTSLRQVASPDRYIRG